MHNSTGYVIKQFVHAFSCALSSYGALGKFGEHSGKADWFWNVKEEQKPSKRTCGCWIVNSHSGTKKIAEF